MQILLVEAPGPQRQKQVEALRSLPGSKIVPKVVTAGGSQEALRLASDGGFDLVIADLVLPKPGLSGADTLLRISEVCPMARTILFTEHGYTEALLAGLSDAFLSREGDPNAYLAKLRDTASRLLEKEQRNKVTYTPTTDDTPTLEYAPTRVLPSRRQETLGDRPRPELIAGKYRLGPELGRGGMGVVYRAEDTFIGRQVAVKLLHLRAANPDPHLEKRMRREVMIAGRLGHPNIVTVFDAGFEGNEIFLVMEMIEGKNLRGELKSHGRLPRDKAIGILRQTLNAVGYAHGEGIMHRDLKLDNVLLTPHGRVKVVDFGLAKLMSIASSSSFMAPSKDVLDLTTADGALIGTMAYMAPEQMAGHKVDHLADIYALGVMLFELVDGRSFGQLVPPMIRASALLPNASPPPLPKVADDPWLNSVLHRALAFLPDDRFPSAKDFADALDEPPAAAEGWRRFLPWTKST
jgi:serine/threonine protein kinase/CheY-like chemotaxis protein